MILLTNFTPINLTKKIKTSPFCTLNFDKKLEDLVKSYLVSLTGQIAISLQAFFWKLEISVSLQLLLGSKENVFEHC